ncbi:MAG: hypothetical protein WCA29_14290 [Jiangellales bacterium]
MGTTLERKGSGDLLPQHGGAPAHETISDPQQRVELHEMPDLTKEAPEVEYGQPKRSWLRYLAVGVTVGAVAVGGGLLISSMLSTDAGFTYGSEYSLAREHLAQAPGGFPATTLELYGGQPYMRPDAPTGFSSALGLEMEHLAQAPGGFSTATVTVPRGAFLDAETPASTFEFPNAGPVNDAPGWITGDNYGPVNDAPAAQ